MAEIALSRREREVLAALADRRTNAEIAAELFLSVRTVETHVSALLRKFDAPNRRALADTARERGSLSEKDNGPVRRLPAALTSFVGRTAELTALAAELSRSRLVTITGPAGVGKTRLALESARTASLEVQEVVFVDLAPVADGPAAVSTIGLAVGLTEEPARVLRDALVARLRVAPMLLVLDNCEHVVEPLASLIVDLLDSEDSLRLLTTSREALAIPGEVVLALVPLQVPTADGESLVAVTDNDAVRLFAERATAGSAGFTLDAESAAAVASICRRLDGIPLALELAAAQVPALTPQQIDSRLRDRFQLLRAPARGRPGRHHTLTAAVEWSYELLEARERALLDRLAVFRGGFTLEAAEAVTAGAPLDARDIVDLLVRLVRKSMVVTEQVGAENRYRLLETIREFGWQRLGAAGELETWRAQHQEWAFARMRAAAQELASSVVPESLAALDDDLDNIEAALDWSMSSPERAADALAVVRSLESYWMARGVRREHGVRWSTAAAEKATTVAASARVEGLLGAVLLVMWSDLEAARALAAQAERLAESPGDPVAQGYAALAGTWVHLFGGDRDRAEPLLRQATALIDTEDPNHPWTLAADAMLRGLAADHAGAAAAMRAAAAASRGQGDAHLAGCWHSCAADFALAAGDLPAARADCDIGMEEARAAGCASCESLALDAVAQLATDPESQLATARDALRMAYEIGEVWGVIGGLEVVVGALAATGAAGDAALLAGASRAVLATTGLVEVLPGRAAALARGAAAAQAALDPDSYVGLARDGAGLDYASAVAHALG